MSALDMVLCLLALPLVAATGYLFILTLFSRRLRPPPAVEPRLRFDVVVPAHDEEKGIARTVASLRALAYPEALRRIVVVADNCSDRTAEEATRAGADVLERTDTERRGKGYALAYAFERSLADGKAAAIVVIDADTVVAPHLLTAFAARIAAGAQSVQARYGVSNALAAWRTRLMALALALFHDLRSQARERLGLSCGLRGNGMCFTADMLRRVPHEAFSVVEDLEYGIRLGEAGVRIHYAAEAEVLGEMVSSEAASRSQRRRWEGGRLTLARRHGLRLLGAGLARRDPIRIDLALDLFVPPLSWLAIWGALGAAASIAASLHAGSPAASCALWGVAWAFLAAYVARGWWLAGLGARGVLDLLWIPVYVVWKVTLALRRSRHAKDAWVRTAREGESR
jgi:1,2-diacylglycerol 3-beta-glucosyltransferase